MTYLFKIQNWACLLGGNGKRPLATRLALNDRHVNHRRQRSSSIIDCQASGWLNVYLIGESKIITGASSINLSISKTMITTDPDGECVHSKRTPIGECAVLIRNRNSDWLYYRRIRGCYERTRCCNVSGWVAEWMES